MKKPCREGEATEELTIFLSQWRINHKEDICPHLGQMSSFLGTKSVLFARNSIH